MPLQQTSGNATADAYGGGVAAIPNYIEDVFSTYLYTGAGADQTITNNIDVSTKGGLVWIKDRTQALAHRLYDTARGVGSGSLETNGTAAQNTFTGVTSFNTNGFSLSGANAYVTGSGDNFASWTFRKQPKFFDVVTYTGDGVAGRTVAHNLGSTPGCIIVKRTDSSSNWSVYHNGLTSAAYNIQLNLNNAQASNTTIWNSTAPTSTVFTVGTNTAVNANGGTYVAYLFAHNAGGFGLTGTDNVISCGSYSGTGALNTITLGYEPQWIMVKNASAAGNNWVIIDNMRGFPAYSTIGGATLFPNASDAENSGGSERFSPTATGFQVWDNAGINNASGNTYIYIAIRRGPMKTPTSGTSVYATDTQGSTGGNPPVFFSNFPVDWAIKTDTTTTANRFSYSRLTGQEYLYTNSTQAGVDGGTNIKFDYNTGYYAQTGTFSTVRSWMFRRAPGFFDEVCYTGNGSNSQSFTHNLTVAPELVIVKRRNGISQWETLVPVAGTSRRWLRLNATAAGGAVTDGHLGWNATDGAYKAPTSSLVYFGNDPDVGLNGAPYVAYLFATCAGVSKVGSYTGNGTTQTINCGFAGGARFVLIKRTDSTGDWYVYDTARGMTTLTDPYLLLNSTAAESATLGSVTTVTTGFALNAAILAAINTNGASYIFLAIA